VFDRGFCDGGVCVVAVSRRCLTLNLGLYFDRCLGLRSGRVRVGSGFCRAVMGRLGSRFAVVVVFGGSSLPAVFGGRALSLPVMSLGTAVVGGSMIVVVVIIVGMAPVVLSQGMVAEEVVVVVAAAVAAHVLSM
jgi:hypothetical protein